MSIYENADDAESPAALTVPDYGDVAAGMDSVGGSEMMGGKDFQTTTDKRPLIAVAAVVIVGYLVYSNTGDPAEQGADTYQAVAPPPPPPYYTLPPSQLESIVRLKLGRLVERLASANHIALEFDAAVYETVAARCTEVDSGARNIDFITRKSLVPPLSDRILGAMAEGRSLKSLHVAPGEGDDWKISATEG